MTEELLFPGDCIANEEEILPGKGMFAENGKVCSAGFGKADKDMEKRVASLKTKIKTPVYFYKGQEVIGVIASVRDKVAFIDLFPSEDENHRYVVPEGSTVLRVTNIRRGFVKTLLDEFKVGDIIRAKVLSRDPEGLSLTINEPHLGVIKAYCGKCRLPMERKDKFVECPECHWKETRKLADDYGKGAL